MTKIKIIKGTSKNLVIRDTTFTLKQPLITVNGIYIAIVDGRDLLGDNAKIVLDDYRIID